MAACLLTPGRQAVVDIQGVLPMRAIGMLLLLIAASVLPASQPVVAQVADPAAGLSLEPQRYRPVIGLPPAAGSRAEADDLAILRWNLRTNTPQAVLHSWSFLDRRLSAFDAAAGVDLGKTAPQLVKGLPAFLKRVDALKDVLKDQIARPRPFVSHPDLKPCVPLESTFSFPSGHATWYSTAALLLADLLPQRRERLLPVGEQGAYARATCALHYPSDVLASQRLAEAISRDVVASPQWRTFKELLKPEIDKINKTSAASLPLLSN
jgi:acid phosphatase (class A)